MEWGVGGDPEVQPAFANIRSGRPGQAAKGSSSSQLKKLQWNSALFNS